jgi:serine/threonine protein kinase
MSVNVADAKQIFLQAVENHEPERWPDFLADVCGTDTVLRERVEALLAAYRQPNRILDASSIPATLGQPSLSEGPGTVIGHYKLLEQIGEGGFGVVFLAEQERPVRRRVALKIIKPGMDTRQVIARFEAERQALAMMDHPNIAKVLDAGTTVDPYEPGRRGDQARGGEGEMGRGGELDVQAAHRVSPSPPLPLSPSTSFGRPYFVMELVQGVPITEYCDQCNLSTRERLELFVTVCQAVQHAHQKGVIHRDIKPTNVLVAMQDGRPTPKIIDFGVAKAIDQRLTEHTLTTAFAQMVGTPLYMSPEQAELSPVGVDTRSDIYSLGVMLYELLAGTTPFDKDRLHAASYDELRRIIREEEPPRPSARISTLAAEVATTVAERRRCDARRLEQTVRGELDWIVMKCLEKDRNRRFETASSLARDVERYLHDEPVQACPPSVVYRLKKFVRRNKIAAAFVLLLVASVAALAVSNVAIKKERDAKTTALAQAKSVSDLLQEMLGSADAANAKGADYKVRELLDDFAAGMGGQLADQPEVKSEIHATIGRAYRSLKLPEKAQPHFEKAIELRRRVDGPQSEQLAAILVDGAWNLQDQWRYADAESQVHEAIEMYRQCKVTGEPLFHALEILQHVLINVGRDSDAQRVTQDALEVARQAGHEFPDQASLLHRYAGLKIRQGHFAEAEKLAQQAVEMHRRLHGEEHPETAWGLSTLGAALEPQQKLAEAEAAFRESLAIFRRQFPEDHFNIRDAIGKLRAVLEARGDKSALEALAKEEAQIAMRSNNPDYRVRLAGLLLASQPPSDDQKDEARRLIQQAIERYRQIATDSPNDYRSRMNAADGYALALTTYAPVPDFADEVNELSRLLEAELPQLLAAFSDSNQCQWEIAMCYLSWGRALAMSSDYPPTVDFPFRKSIEILENYSLSDPHRPYLWIWLSNSYAVLGDVQWRLGRLEDAEASFQSAIKICEEHEAKIAADIAGEPFSGINLEIAATYLEHGLLLAASHREDEAAESVRKATLYANRITHPVELVNALYHLAIAQLRLGDQAGYRATCKALVNAPTAGVDDHSRWRATWACCLAHDALDDPSLPVKRAKEFVANNSLNQHHFALQGLGAALYRARRYEDAAEVLQESLAAYPSDVPHGYASINYTRLLLAMTMWHQGQQDEARRLLEEWLPDVDKELQTPSLQFHRRATLEILRREAVALIGPNEAVEAVDNEDPTDKSSNQ